MQSSTFNLINKKQNKTYSSEKTMLTPQSNLDECGVSLFKLFKLHDLFQLLNKTSISEAS